MYGLGEWQESDGLRARPTEVRQDVSKYDQTPDRAVLFEICGAGSGGTVSSWASIIAADEEGGIYPGASSGYEDYPRPGFPFTNAEIPDNGCVKGWVVFPTNADTKITKAAFETVDGRALAWRLD